MKTIPVFDPNLAKVAFDSAILSVLPFPALVFNVNTLTVLKSNSFFCNEKDEDVIPMVAKYGFGFLDEDDFHKISKALFSNQNYVVHKLHETSEEIKTYEVHAYLLPDGQTGFLYFNLLSNHKLSDLNLEILGGWGQGFGVLNSKYKILIGQLPFGVFRISVEGKFVYANTALTRILGYDSEEELCNVHVDELFLGQNRWKQQLEHWRDSIIYTDEVQLKTKSGRIIYVKAIGLRVLNKLDEIDFIDGIVEDISDRVLMKQELTRAKDKVLEADNLKTTFLTNMSHEIRTPMNSILGFSSMLKRKGVNVHKRKQYLDIIISRGKHLMQMLNDILDMTRIDEGQIQVSPSTLVLNNFLEDLYQFFDFELKTSNKPIKLIKKVSLLNEDSMIILDYELLHRIFSNLLNNAIKFTNEGCIEFGYTIDKEKNMVFYVKDTGIGIPPDYLNSIFDRFRQVDGSFTRAHDGMGLGLSLCKGLVELMGGKIWVESDSLNGSTFYFTVNCVQDILRSGKDEPKFEGSNEIRWHNKLVLIVEDDPASYEYLYEILTAAGCEVLHADSAKNAIELFRETNFIDLILLDIQLPEMDGYQLAKQIREHDTRVPIIAQTAHTMSDDRRKCVEAGCNGYITKPIPYDLLMDTLQEYLC